MSKTYSDYGIDMPDRGTGERATLCPQCSHTRRKKNQRIKCLSVNLDKRCWRCNHCNWSGGLPPLDAGQNSPPRKPPVSAPAKKPEYQRPNWQDPGENYAIDPDALAWFKTRGITETVIRRNRITTEKVFMPQVGKQVMTIAYPFLDNGQCINIKYRDLSKNFRMVKDAQRILYGLDDIDNTMVFIVEGEMDKLALASVDINSVVSVPNGAPATSTTDYDTPLEFLKTHEDRIKDVECFAIAVDNDEPGRKLEQELIRRLGPHRCLIVRWPEDCKDANDVLIKHGPGTLASFAYSGRPIPIEGIISVEDIMDQLTDLYENGRKPGIELRWDNLADLYRVSTSQWTLVTGSPGSGKSEWIDAVAIDLAVNHNWKFAVYSPENTPIEEHVAKLLEKYTGEGFACPYGQQNLIKMSPDTMQQAAAWVNQHFFFVNPNDDNFKLDAILNMTEQLVAREGIKGVVIDPWNELDHQRPQQLTETEYISQCLTRLRQCARKHDIHIWLVAHPTKLRKTDSGKYPVATPYDVAGSAHFFNKAFNCISIWRDTHPDHRHEPVQVHVQKIKFKKDGRLGMAKLSYNTMNGRYHDYRETITYPQQQQTHLY